MGFVFRILMLYIIVLFLLLMLNMISCRAADYRVDFKTIDAKNKIHALIMEIDGCETVFTVKSEELSSLKDDNEKLRSFAKEALMRAKNGCR